MSSGCDDAIALGSASAAAAVAAAAPAGARLAKAASPVGRILAALLSSFRPFRSGLWALLRRWRNAFFRQLANSDYLAGMLAMSAMGMAREVVSRTLSAFGKWIVRRLWATIRLEEKEAELLRAWLRERPELHASAELALYSHRDTSVGPAHLYEYEPEVEQPTRLRAATRKGSRWIWVTHHADKTAVVSVLGRDKGAVEEILEQGRAIQKKRRERYLNVVQVYTSKSGHGIRWLHPQDRVGRQLGRPISSVILPRCPLTGLDQATALLRDVREFLESEWWYCERGIPYRRGYLLHGKPGSGKSSLIMALAHELQLPIYMLQLSSEQMSDDTLNSLLQYGMHDPPTILLLEDVDLVHSAVLHRRKQRAGGIGGGVGLSDGEEEQEAEQAETDADRERREGKKRGRLTLSGLLNALDGPTATVGRLLFMTTNARDRLDPALLRSGRIDYELRFGESDADQIRRLFMRFYTDTGSGRRQTASHLRQSLRGNDLDDELDADAVSPLQTPAEVAGAGPKPATASSSDAPTAAGGTAGDVAHGKAVAAAEAAAPGDAGAAAKTSPNAGKNKKDLEALAADFAERVINSSARVTTADIQRHLMHHKRNPERALKELQPFLHGMASGGGDFAAKPEVLGEVGSSAPVAKEAVPSQDADGPMPGTGGAADGGQERAAGGATTSPGAGKEAAGGAAAAAEPEDEPEEILTETGAQDSAESGNGAAPATCEGGSGSLPHDSSTVTDGVGDTGAAVAASSGSSAGGAGSGDGAGVVTTECEERPQSDDRAEPS